MDRPDGRQGLGCIDGPNPAKTAPLGHSGFGKKYASNELADLSSKGLR
jgi:hypothetical protein